MQIREQGQQVQLIRSPYDSTKKRCVQKVVHTFKQQYSYSSDDITKYLSAEQVLDLSDNENKTLSDWLRVKSDKYLSDARKTSISLADIFIVRAADAISSDGVSAEKASEIWQAMDQLSKMLKKAGHPKSAFKPAGPAPVVPGVVPGQLPLE